MSSEMSNSWQNGDLGLALSDYEKAVFLDPDFREPHLRLMELFERLDQKEKIKELGNHLFAKLREDESATEAFIMRPLHEKSRNLKGRKRERWKKTC